MNPEIKTTTDIKLVAEFVADKILKQLDIGKNVLWFIAGGSVISVAVEASKIISKHPHKNLIVTQTDERYGVVGHADSNWQQLVGRGFILPEATLIPILTGDDIALTTEKFNETLAYECNVAGYSIGLFGVGADGHVAGILPGIIPPHKEDLVFSHDTPTFRRVTITPKAIEGLDEAVVFMQGKEKWGVVKDLEKNIDIIKQPAQVLKKVSKLTIFTDYQQ